MTTTENVLGFFLWGFITRTEVHAVLLVVIFIGGPFLLSLPGGMVQGLRWSLRRLRRFVAPAAGPDPLPPAAS